MSIQNITGLMLDAIWLGVVFAKVSLPRYRGRSIYMSDKAVVARRDGRLMFMFRVADIRYIGKRYEPCFCGMPIV
jgi:potassium inwardly-rectifying channel subfamily J, other